MLDEDKARQELAAEIAQRRGLAEALRESDERIRRLQGGAIGTDAAGLLLGAAVGSESAIIVGDPHGFTERVAAETALRDSESRLRLAMDAGRMGTWEFQIASGKVVWSPGLEEIHGLEPGAFGGRFEDFLSDVYPDDRDYVVSQVQRTLQEGIDHHIEYRILPPDGKLRWVEGRGKVFKDANGDPLRMIGICMDVTGRKDAERAVRESEAELADLFDNAAVGIQSVNEEGVIVRANRALLNALGYTREEYVGQKFERFHTDPEDLAETARIVFGGEEVRNRPVSIRCRNGSIKHFLVDSSARSSGGTRQTRCFFRDVTELKSAEDALRRSEELFRHTTQAMPQMVWSGLPDGHVEHMNRRWEEWTGQPIAEALGWGWTKVLHPDDLERTQSIWDESLREGTLYEIEYRLCTPEGSYRWYLGRALPMRDPDGRIVRWFGSCTDIHEYKQTQEALRESEGRFRILADSAPVLIWLADEQNYGTYFNNGWLEFTGQSLGEARGSGWLRSVHPDDIDGPLKVCRESFEKREQFQTTFRLRRADGEYRYMLDSGTPRFTPDGKFLGYVGSCIDITEQREATDRLREEVRINETLYRIGGVIAAELDIEKVVQTVTDEARALTGAQFGAFFYNRKNEQGEDYNLYTISGVPREAFSKFPMPRNTPLFEPIYSGSEALCIEDVHTDPRFGKMAPHHGMPKGHLPVRSMLAAPVISRTGKVLGGLFFGHGEPGVFGEKEKRILVGLAHQASAALDNAALYEEARKAEARLSRQLRFTSAIASSLGEGLYAVNAEGKLTFMNPAAEAILGWSSAELEGKNIHELIHIERGEGCPLQAAVKTGRTIRSEDDTFRRRDGTLFPVSYTSAPIEEEGLNVGAVVAFRDITERKAAEKALDASQMRFRRMAESDVIGVIHVTMDGKVLYINNAFAKMLGYTVDEMMNPEFDWSGINSPEEQESTRERFAAMKRGEKIDRVEKQYRHRDGHLVPVLAGVAPVDENETAGFVIDLTDQKAAQEALEHSEERLRLALSASHMGVYYYDRTEGISWRDANLNSMIGLEAKESTGPVEQFLPHIHPEDYDRVRAEAAKIFQEGKQYEREYRIVRTNGAVRWWHDTGKVLHDADGQPRHMTGVILDMTEQREAEIRLTAEHAITKYLAAAHSLMEVAEPIIKALCESTPGAAVAKLWLRQPDDLLRCVSYWPSDNTDLKPFLDGAVSRGLSVGEGLPGLVWQRLQPIVVGDIEEVPDFPRREMALSAGLRSCWVVPIMLGEDFFGVIDIYAFIRNEPSEAIVRMAAAIGHEVAQFLLRVRAEEEVLRLNRDLEQRLGEMQTIMDVIPVGLAVSRDPECREMTFNPNFSEILRLPVSSLSTQTGVQQGYKIFRGGEPFPLEELPMQKAARNGTRFSNVECDVVFDDGETKRLLINAVPLFDPDGNVRGCIGAHVDITERLRAEEALRENEERLRIATEAGELGTWDWDVRSDVIVWSDRTYEIHGVQRGEAPMKVQDYIAIVDPQDVERVGKAIEEALAGKSEYRLEFRIIQPSGAVRWFFTRAIVLRDDSGQPQRMIGVGLDVTERKQAELALRISNERFEYMARATNDAVWDWDLDGNSVWWSDAITTVFGHERRNVLTTADGRLSLIHPDDRERVSHSVHAVIESEKTHWREEYRFLRADGSYAEVLDRGYTMRDETGRAFRMTGAVSDISELKRTEQALRRSEERLRSALYASETGTFYWFIQSSMVEADDNMARLFGMPTDRRIMPTQELLDRIHPEDMDGVSDAIRKCALEGADFDMQFRVVWKDGSIHWISDKAKVFFDLNGAPLYLAGACVDVTERKKAEEALRESERRFRTMADAAPVLIWVGGVDKGCTYFNKVWLEFTGRTMEQEAGMGWAESVHPEDRESCIAVYRSSFDRREPFSMEFRLRRSEGEYRWMLDIGVPRFNPDKSFAGYIGSCIDITERREAEQALIAVNKELEAFAYVASHDLKAPLRAVSGYVQLLERRYSDLLDDDARKYISGTVSSVEQMTLLINDLLAFSRVQRVDRNVGLVPLNGVMTKALANLAMDIKESGAVVKFANLPSVRGEQTLLIQLMQNLIGNAIKFRKQGLPLIITIKASRGDGEWIVSVQDNGIGIDPRYKDRIFVLFKRLNSSTRYPGTGIGLAICKKITERHGGRIWVESQRGEGATFSFSLPVRGVRS